MCRYFSRRQVLGILLGLALSTQLGAQEPAPSTPTSTNVAPAAVPRKLMQTYISAMDAYKKGAYLEAIPLAQESLQLHQQTLGEAHDGTRRSMSLLGDLYRATSDFAKALPLAKQALALAEQYLPKEHPSIGNNLNNLASIYQAIGQYEQAQALYERALHIAIKNFGEAHESTATSLNNLAGLYEAKGDYAKALPLYQRALAMSEKLAGKDGFATGAMLNNLAGVQRATGAYDQALASYQRALTIAEQTRGLDHASTARSLNNLASLYVAMGAYDKALPLARRAAQIFVKTDGPESPSTATSISNLAGVYRHLGQTNKAMPLYEKSLAIMEKKLGPEHPDTAAAMHNLAFAYQSNGSYDKALPLSQRSLAIAETKLGAAHPATITSINNLAALHEAKGETSLAQARYAQAFALSLARYQSGADAALLATVAENFSQFTLNNSPKDNADGIFYGKLALNVRQQQRGNIQELDGGLQLALRKMVDQPYQLLARSLSKADRIGEAEQVLLALKDVEYAQYMRSSAASFAPLSLNNVEQAMLNDVNQLAAKLAKVYLLLDQHAKKIAVLSEEDLARELQKRSILQQQLTAQILDAKKRLQSTAPQLAQMFDRSDTSLTSLSANLARSSFGEKNVIVMYALEDSITTVLIDSPDGPAALYLPIGKNQLAPLIDSFRTSITARGAYQETARLLYRHLIQPVEAHLQQRQLAPKTLMLYLTDRLRYLPFAVLQDEQGRHVIEKYRLAVLSKTASGKASLEPQAQWSITAFGSSKGSASLPPLRAVPGELAAIVRSKASPQGILPGQALLDEAFTHSAWQSMLYAKAGGERRKVLHIASHFAADAGAWQQSSLLLGDGQIYKVDELEQELSVDLSDVELVTLSACRTEITGAGDGREFEGLGAVFQRKGAQAVLGSLWDVQDESAALLMRSFYAARGEQRQMSKAAALQAAQLDLLQGRVKAASANVDLRHPFYWGQFVLMGNWL